MENKGDTLPSPLTSSNTGYNFYMVKVYFRLVDPGWLGLEGAHCLCPVSVEMHLSFSYTNIYIRNKCKDSNSSKTSINWFHKFLNGFDQLEFQKINPVIHCIVQRMIFLFIFSGKKSARKDEQYRLMFSELEKFVIAHSVTSPRHYQVLECLMQVLKI